LSENRSESAMSMLQENPEKIFNYSFSKNPSIFYDDPSYVLK